MKIDQYYYIRIHPSAILLESSVTNSLLLQLVSKNFAVLNVFL